MPEGGGEADVEAVPVMVEPEMGGGGDGALGMLAHSNKFTIQQKVQMLEAVTMGCIEQPNSYDIIDASNNRKIMVAHTPTLI